MDASSNDWAHDTNVSLNQRGVQKQNILAHCHICMKEIYSTLRTLEDTALILNRTG